MTAEDDLIARYFAPFAGAGALALKDDAAFFTPQPGEDMVLTKDMLVAGVHFFPDDPPASIARKALRVNLSDLAAKAARPCGFLLGLALPKEWREKARERWLTAFSTALRQEVDAHDCPLLGGDTVSTTEALVISVTVFGAVPSGRMLRRGGVRPGDALLVSGTIGDAALGLKLRLDADSDWARTLSVAHRSQLTDRYLNPQPRNALAPALLMHANAGMDVSDGLIGDLAKMLAVSGCGGVLELDALPLSASARKALASEPALIETVATGGDDYEVLCACPPEKAEKLIADAAKAGVALTRIGAAGALTDGFTVISRGAPVRFARQSYSHV